MERQDAGTRSSARAQASAELLEEALGRPGIPEIMRVYGDWRETDRRLDPHRATSDAYCIVVTDHANQQ
jgi:hypothetical protein